jgi:hypothetical protein
VRESTGSCLTSSRSSSQRYIAARDIHPGDHLPPQAALHGTRYQNEGFTIGADDRDVLAGTAVVPGRLLLFGPSGSLASVALDTQVTVRCEHEPTGRG